MRISGKRVQEAQQQFVDDACDLPAPPVPVMPTTGRLAAGELPLLAQLRELGLAERAVLDAPTASAPIGRSRRRCRTVAGAERPSLGALGAPCARAHDVVDHPDEAQVHAVVRVVDALDAVGLQLGDLLRRDRAAAAAEHADVAGAALAAACRPCT